MEMSSPSNDQNRIVTRPLGPAIGGIQQVEGVQAHSLSDSWRSEFLSHHQLSGMTTSLSLSFLLHKMGIMVPSPRNCKE